MRLTKIGRIVTCELAAVDETADTGSVITVPALIPSAYRPAVNNWFVVRIRDNGAIVIGGANVAASTGNVSVYASINTNFAGTGITGWDQNISLTWTV